MAPEKDYTHRSWIAVTLLIAVLIGLSLIPPQTLGGVSLRKAKKNGVENVRDTGKVKDI